MKEKNYLFAILITLTLLACNQESKTPGKQDPVKGGVATTNRTQKTIFSVEQKSRLKARILKEVESKGLDCSTLSQTCQVVGILAFGEELDLMKREDPNLTVSNDNLVSALYEIFER